MDLVFPPCCPVCGGIIPSERRLCLYGAGHDARGEKLPAYICPQCIGEFDFIKPPYCRKCGKQLFDAGDAAGGYPGILPAGCRKPFRGGLPYADRDDAMLCADCSRKERSFISCRCLMTYDETAREVLLGIKYHGQRESAVCMGLIAAERLGGWIKDISPDVIVPVPVHKKRLRKRGYNQAEVIARSLGDELGIAVSADVLKREHHTAALKSLGAAERLEALRNAFSADFGRNAAYSCRPEGAGSPTPGSGPSVLLVDDIYTTGATMQQCTECLLGAGAGKVYGLAIAAGSDVIKA